jgi:ATP-binding cassette, subfamily B, bacterial
MNIPIKQYWALLVNYLRPQWPMMALLAGLLFSGVGLQLANPQILRYFIDTAQASGPVRALFNAALLFIGVAVVQQIISVTATYVGENVGWTATNALRADLAQHCLRLDMAFHNARTPGELIERIDGDITVLANFFSQFVLRVMGNVLLLVGVLLLLFREDWRVGAALSILALGALAVLYRIRDIATPHWTRARQATAEQIGFVEERFAGTEDIRSSGAVPYVMRQLYELLRKLYLRYRAARIWGHHAFFLTRMVMVLGRAIGLAVGAYLFYRGAVTIGTVYLISYYVAILGWPLEQIIDQVQDLQQASASISRVEELSRIPVTIQDGPGATFSKVALSVEFENVRFGYGMTQTSAVLNDISFHLAPGRVLGLLGRTGSGKTSLTRLLFRLYDPDQGVIRLGGVNIKNARLAELRERIGLVTQEVQLFQATIRDNLTFFDPTISDEHILHAIDDLGLSNWLRSLPQGLNTELASSGSGASGGRGLSAGEAQLLAFTRVLLKNPGLVILDEASSRLDPATERLIERAVDKLLHPADHARPGRTAIIIAHRLATVLRADEIMILEAGRIVEHGPREQLMADPNSRFSELLRTGLETALA